MQGSLDDPPIIVRGSRKKALKALLLSALIIALFLFVIMTPHAYPTLKQQIAAAIAPIMLIVFALMAALSAWRLFRPEILELSPDGLHWRGTLRNKSWAWSDIKRFAVHVMTYQSGTLFTRSNQYSTPGLIYSDSYQGKRTFSAGSDVDAWLENEWEMEPAALCDLLNSAREKWSGRN